MESDLTSAHVWLVLMKSHRACSAYAQRSIEATGLCYSDFAALEALLHKGPLTVSEIGEKVSLTSGSITTAVDRLEGRGLVQRQSSENDRRSKVVSLTKAGQKLIKSSFDTHENDMDTLLDCLSQKEKAEFIKLLKKLGQAALTLM